MNLDIDLPVFYIKLIHYLITKMTFALGYNLIPSGTGANQVCIDTYGLFVSKLMRNYRSGLDQIFTKVNNDVLIKNDSFVFKMSGLNENICIEHKVRFIPISEYELYNIDDNGIYKVFNNDNIIKILDKECGIYNIIDKITFKNDIFIGGHFNSIFYTYDELIYSNDNLINMLKQMGYTNNEIKDRVPSILARDHLFCGVGGKRYCKRKDLRCKVSRDNIKKMRDRLRCIIGAFTSRISQILINGTYNLNCKGILIKRIMSIILNDRHDEFSYLSNIDPMTLDDINPFYIDSIDATEVYKLVKEEIKDLKQILMDDFELKKLYEDTILISEKKMAYRSLKAEYEIDVDIDNLGSLKMSLANIFTSMQTNIDMTFH